MTFLDVGQGDACVIEAPAPGGVVVVDGGGRPAPTSARPTTRARASWSPFCATGASDRGPDRPHARRRRPCPGPERGRRPPRRCGAPWTAVTAASRRRICGCATSCGARIPSTAPAGGQIIDLGGGARGGPASRRAQPTPTGRSGTNNNASCSGSSTGAPACCSPATPRRRPRPTCSLGRRPVRRPAQGRPPWLPVVVHRALPLRRVSRSPSSPAGATTPTTTAPDVLRRLARQNVRVFRTDRHGALTVQTDGARLRHAHRGAHAAVINHVQALCATITAVQERRKGMTKTRSPPHDRPNEPGAIYRRYASRFMTLCGLPQRELKRKLIRDRLNLTDQQIEGAMEHIQAHRAEVDAEYRSVLQDAEENRRYWETRNRERLAQIAATPFKPEQEEIREKLQISKTKLGLP